MNSALLSLCKGDTAQNRLIKVRQVLAEIILCTKDVNAKTRKHAYNALRDIAALTCYQGSIVVCLP